MPRGGSQKWIGRALIVLGLAFIYFVDTELTLFGLISDIGGLILVSIGWKVILKGRKKAQLTLKEKLERDHRPPVLLLRSFKHDEIEVGSNQSLFSLMRLIPSPFTNDAQLEDRITKQIEEIGPFVTIGKLNEALPPLGASREYLDENWKESISRLIELSALVVVILDFTESLLWEIDQIFLTKSVSQV